MVVLSSSPSACINQPISCYIPQIHNISAIAPSLSPRTTISTRRALSVFVLTTSFSGLIQQFSLYSSSTCWSKSLGQDFVELPNSGGVKALDLRIGDGETPVNGDKVAIHYYGRLAAKQGWRFDSTYDHKDATGEPIPFQFILGSGKRRKSVCQTSSKENTEDNFHYLHVVPNSNCRKLFCATYLCDTALRQIISS